MFKKLLAIALVLFLLFVGYQIARATGLLPDKTFAPLEAKIPSTSSLPFTLPWQNEQDLEHLGQNSLAQIKILADKAKEAGGVAQGFVEEVVQEDKSDQRNVSEKAFDYGKYIYCQEVVRQYEQNKTISF